MGGKGEGFQEHVQRAHGQNQRWVESRVGRGHGCGGGQWGRKWRQLYFNDNKKFRIKKEYTN